MSGCVAWRQRRKHKHGRIWALHGGELIAQVEGIKRQHGDRQHNGDKRQRDEDDAAGARPAGLRFGLLYHLPQQDARFDLGFQLVGAAVTGGEAAHFGQCPLCPHRVLQRVGEQPPQFGIFPVVLDQAHQAFNRPFALAVAQKALHLIELFA
ncbi:MAG: hypothetical protein B6D42_07325 [Anaerolineae bacterium UTCFX5]|nr:MAG: hypothetical protein B6D42_07325 [Anaerolineae bacterium UTCFX5]